MKLLTLNIWGGQVLDPLLDFITKNKDIDIFCLQEVLNEDGGFGKTRILKNVSKPCHNVYTKIQDILDNHQGYFAQSKANEGLAIFVKKDIKVEESGSEFIFKHKNIQFVKMLKENKKLTVFNFHGLWIKEGKDDTKERIIQSENIKRIIDLEKNEKILVGDFNLNPNTKSLDILETELINLIKKYKIKSTRTQLFSGLSKGEFFADYILVSKTIDVLDFRVLPDTVSDHSPLIIEFDLS